MMPPRRSYKKSTAGCKTCKRRRVKCDETHPKCGQCNKHGVLCDFASTSVSSTAYMTLAQDTERLRPLTPETLLRGPMLEPLLSPPLHNGRLIEMRLVHHCTFMICETMRVVQDARLRHIWSTEVPSMAFQSGPSNHHLLNLLLAVSALHLRSLNPNDHEVRMASSYYLDLGLQKFIGMLDEITEENSPFLFVSSVLVALYSSVSRLELKLGNQYSVPGAWFRTLHGISTIISISRPGIRKSNLEPLLLKNQLSSRRRLMDGDTLFTGLLAGLEDASLDLECMTVYVDAVRYLSWAYALHQAQEEKDIVRRHILAFPTTVPAQYISLLECHDPRALVITAHFFGLVTCVDEIWWLEGLANQEIMGILTLVPDDWLWAMKWPIEQIQHGDVGLKICT